MTLGPACWCLLLHLESEGGSAPQMEIPEGARAFGDRRFIVLAIPAASHSHNHLPEPRRIVDILLSGPEAIAP